MLRRISVILFASLSLAAVAIPAWCQDDSSTEIALSFRTWTDSSGKYKTEAAMVEFSDSEVHLQKRDGKVTTVAIGKLSVNDRSYVRRELARRRRAEQDHANKNRPGNSAAAVNWPGWRGPQRNGKSSDQGLLKQWPAEGPTQMWKVQDIGKGFSTVAVVNDTVYTTGEISSNLVLSAFHTDGLPKWQVPVTRAYTKSHPGSRSTPTIDEGNLYLVSGGGLIGCYDATNGKRKWSRGMKEFGGRMPEWGYSESVLIHQDLAIVTPGGSNCIVALNKKSGRPVWTSTGFEAGAQYGSCYSVTHEGIPMIVTGTDQGIVAVHADNGQRLWTNSFSAGNTANCPTPVFEDGYLFWANGYGKGGICLKLDVQRRNVSANQAWTTRDMVCHHGGYIIHEGYIYGNHNSTWVCLDLQSGEMRWQERAVGKGSVCFADGMLYLFSESGGKAALATCSPDGLEIRGNVSVDGEGPSWAHPVVAGGRLYLRYDDNLYCFDVGRS